MKSIARTLRGFGPPIRVIEQELEGRLGHYAPDDGVIAIDPRQSWAGKHVVLQHELLHVVDHHLQDIGITSRPIPHRWIINASTSLVMLQVAAGLNGELSKAELKAFAKNPWCLVGKSKDER